MGKKPAIVIANFSDQEETISLWVPKHFFEFAGIREKSKVTLTDMLSGTKTTQPFTSEAPLTISLPVNLGIILL